ncbi:hypothetical protein J5N97_003266 [Dioscorea zingiberensis]|uniref:Small ribosomal subunit protein uS15c n=1 Tax=Dioscorea zingiberensis TaxID=325984 RepID=A0A9D5D6D4_9LILI|nr:hypothetical protein J5N97_003266 [Dioscorea zingiberensis]
MAVQLHLKPKTLTLPLRSLRHFSSSSPSSGGGSADDGDGEPSSSPPPPSYTSYFSDIKERLRSRQAPPRRIPTERPSPPPLSKPSPPASLEEIRKHLTGYRSRSPSGDAASSSSPPISFQELFKSNVLSKPQDDTKPELPSFSSIRASLSQFKASPTNQSRARRDQFSGSLNEKAIQESSRWRTGEGGDAAARFLSHGVRLPESVFGEETKEKQGEGEKKVLKTKFAKPYGYDELGEKLRKLRPDEARNGGTGWFSLQELNERLAKLRELDDMKSPRLFADLQDSLENIQKAKSHKQKNMQMMSFLWNLGGQTPSFMLKPPQEHLLENYFHPDHMSSAEKMKLELKRVRDEFKLSESDCGSARVQVAQLTTKIKHLSGVLHKKDKHSRKGLQEMVQRRKKLLKYLRRTDWDSYCFVLSKLGLRDVPEYKIPDYKTHNKDKKVKSKKSGKSKSKKTQKPKSQQAIPA